MHTTNYYNTFIEIAEDSLLSESKIPKPGKSAPTVAEMQYDMISNHPYKYTSDEILLDIYMKKNDIPEFEKEKAKEAFFSKGQPCLRCSPLAKTHGFGFHFNQEGKVALVPRQSENYETWSNDNLVAKTRAMRSKKA